MKHYGKRKRFVIFAAAGLMTAMVLSACEGAGGTDGNITASESAQESNERNIHFDASLAKAAGQKEETVNVKADAAGTPQSITSSIRLSEIDDAGFVLDESALTNIRNTEGDEEFEQNGEQLLWENKGEDITYEGDASEKPDLGIEVSYYLNGKKVSPEEIAGKSGDVRICFNYKNNVKDLVEINGAAKEMTVPYLFLTVAMLDETRFSDVEVKNGTISHMDDVLLVAGTAVPGLKQELGISGLESAKNIDLPEYVEVRAKANDFQLDFTTTIASSGLFEDLDTEKLKDGDDLIASMKELRSASSEILDGISALAEGSGEFDKALKSYTDGAAELGKGTQAFAEGANQLSANGTELRNGAAQLAAGLSQLNAQLQALDEGDTADYTELFKNAENALNGLAADIAALEARFPEDANVDEMTETEAEQYTAIRTVIAEEKTYLAILQQIFAGLMESAGSKDTDTLESLKTIVQALSDGAAGLDSGMGQYLDGVEQLKNGADQLKTGADSLSSGGTELYKGYGALTEGIRKLKEGYATFDEEGIAELSKLAGDDLQTVFNQLRALKKIDNQSRSFSGAAAGTKASVQYIIETEKVEKQHN